MAFLFLETVEAVQCFCTSRDQPCQTPICEGSWCLVGFKHEGNCSFQKYSSRFQNFFSFGICLPWHFSHFQFPKKFTRFLSHVDLVQTCGTDVARSLSKCARKLNEWDEVCSCQEDFCNTFAYLRENIKNFDNNPQAKKDMQGFDTSRIVDEKVSKSNKPNKNQHLVLLLVIIPLGVGALTVCLIFLNYHCKMC